MLQRFGASELGRFQVARGIDLRIIEEVIKARACGAEWILALRWGKRTLRSGRDNQFATLAVRDAALGAIAVQHAPPLRSTGLLRLSGS